MTDITIARATHDLNGVHTLHVTGWGNSKNYVLQPDDTSTGVTLWAPRVHRGEEWTFPRTENGVLAPHSNTERKLTDKRAPGGPPLVIRMPRNKIGKIKVIVE